MAECNSEKRNILAYIKITFCGSWYARELRAKMQVVTSALLLFTLHFSFVVVKPIQSKQVGVSVLHLASYLCLHHTRLYYFSTYCTHENSMMAFMTTL